MRIFLSCMQSPERYAISAYDFWESYFKSGLAEAGHEWVEAAGVDWAKGLTFTEEADRRRWRERTWAEVLRVIRQEREKGGVDLFLGYLYPHMVEPAAIDEIRRLGIPCVNFFCDNVREFRTLPGSFECFDLHWVPEFEALPMYERAGSKHVFAPMPCWIPPGQRRSDHAESSDATFVGSRDPLRAHLLGSAIRLGSDISIAGAGWKRGEARRSAQGSGMESGLIRLLRNQQAFIRQHGFAGWLRKFANRIHPLPPVPIPEERLLGTVSEEEYVRLIQQSRVALGVNRVETFQRSLRLPLSYSRLRDIEAPMMGACYLTEWTESLSRLYDVGRHVESYRTAGEMAGKIRELLADPKRRQSLRTQGQAHALAELSVPRTIGKITQALGIP